MDSKNGDFLKTTGPQPAINSEQKAALNRKGNILYNSGDIEGAKRIFLTTGYSDGIARIGDAYKSAGKAVDALQMYWKAPDKAKAEPIVMQLAELIRAMIDEKGTGDE